MRNCFVLALSVLLLAAIPVMADEAAPAAQATGDAALDESLQGLNAAVKKDVGGFAKRLAQHYHMPEATVDWLLTTVGMTPGDAYMAAKVSRLSGRSPEAVAEAYQKNRGKGWGVIARELGIKPGSAEFHALKKDEAGLFEDAKDKGKGQTKNEKKAKGKKKE